MRDTLIARGGKGIATIARRYAVQTHMVEIYYEFVNYLTPSLNDRNCQGKTMLNPHAFHQGLKDMGLNLPKDGEYYETSLLQGVTNLRFR